MIGSTAPSSILGGFVVGVAHLGLCPGRWALLYMGVLAMWVQLEIVAERGCWWVIPPGLPKILAASYFCTVL